MADVAETPSVETQEEVAQPAEAQVLEAKNGDAKEDPAPAAEEAAGGISKQERAIIRQVEYYFGDANLNRDKFLREQIGKNEDGWVPLSVLVTFKRLASLSTDLSEIVAALNKSEEGLVEISEDKLSLRRHPERPIPEHNEERRKEIQERTAYAKGFPLDSQISELLDFAGNYDKVVNLTMRKHYDKPTKSYKFKGSIFLTFETKDQAKAFLEQEKIVYKERELLRKWQVDYLKEKQEEYAQKNEKRKNKKETKPEPAFELPKNAIVVFEGAPETSSREEIREAFEKIKDFDVAYIEFAKGETKGSVRLTEADAAEKYIAKVEEGKLKFNDEVSLSLRKATEEEEKEFIDKAIEFMKKRRDFTRNKGKRFNRKRHGGNDHKHGGGKKARGD
ncbi:la protein homolog [Drosophila sechellia]|uniref:GM23332 n=2 Tax=melanogaster subgroup TaxID=32351 RepID=B4IFB3_DROSE|nr:la protein homolog [Drosophila sechellia]XP_033169323.1 la protein homolog [Drosophila mauritiana]EDW46335.1 GM23332 [Drosophila sechellia]